MRIRRIGVLASGEAAQLDVVGPLEVFNEANGFQTARRRPAAYELLLLRRGHLPTVGQAWKEQSYTEAGGLDTLIVTSGGNWRQPVGDPQLLAWVADVAPRTRRVCSVCTGAFVLAAAGLLDGRRATTHWRHCDELARRHPRIIVEPDPIFVRDGRFYSSAGSSAGMDLALALVEDDLGHDAALSVARELVLFLQRPGGQSQFSAQLTAQRAARGPIKELQGWMADHPDADLSVDALAERVAMSPRNFARVFRQELGLPPARYVELLRVDSARMRLEQGGRGVDQVAEECGFGTTETMRRTFIRLLGVSPSAYRGRFRARG